MRLAVSPLRDILDIAKFLEAHAGLHALLVCVESLELPDAWIGAGFIRNAIWDVLHGREMDIAHLADIDVIFFDPADMREEREADLEFHLRKLAPGFNWSVRNQARMHLRNGDFPYRNTLDAIAHWPETATAIAARTVQERVEVIAPYGIDDLVNLVVRPTSAFVHKMDIYHKRVASKKWSARWPELKLLVKLEET